MSTLKRAILSSCGRVLFLSLFLVLASCGRHDSGGAVTPTADGAALPALDLCQQAQEQSLTTPRAGRTILLAEGCAEVFSLPMCQESVRLSALAAPGLRTIMIALACQRSYCSFFEGEPPPFCDLDLASESTETLREPWQAFLAEIMSLEHHLEAGSPELLLITLALNELMFADIDDVTLPQSTPLTPRTLTLVVHLQAQGSGVEFSASLGEARSFGPFSLPLEPDVEDFSGLLEAALREANGCPATIMAADDVEEVLVIRLVEALRTGGITEFTIEGSRGSENRQE